MERTVYESVNEKINIAIMQRENQKNALDKAIADSRVTIKQESETMVNATIANDIEEYREAKRKKDFARDALELYEARVEHLEKQAYVSDDEGKEIVKQVREEQEEAVLNALQEIRPLLEQIDTIAIQAINVVNEGNELIRKWHTEVVPFKKKIGFKGEKPVYVNEAPCYYAKDFTNYVQHIKSHPMFLQIVGTK